MSAREDGEFELVLGNKQLLSVLFIVIVLLGVFFAMGFIAGRSTGGEVAESDKDAPRVIPGAIPDTAAPPAATEAKTVPLTSEPSLSPPPAATLQTPPPAPSQPAGSAFVEIPTPGAYLQVAATSRVDAENLHNMLDTNGLSGCITPVPRSPQLIRVLVGPIANEDAMASARAKLKELGIDKAITVKY